MPTRLKAARWYLGLALAPLALACGTTQVCTADSRAGLRVDVRDAATGLPAAEQAVVVAREGDFEESLGQATALSFVGLYERAGVYRVTVTKPGYATLDTAGVRVAEDRCHVRLTTIAVGLEPL